MTSALAMDGAQLIQFAINRAYRRMMAATTESEQRRWCDLLKHWAARAAA